MKTGWRGVRPWAARCGVLLLLSGAGYGVYLLGKPQSAAAFPNTRARKGEFLVLIRCRGQLQARRSVGVYTPVVPSLRIAWVAPAGAFVKADDTIVRFDSSTAKQQLMQKEAQLKQAQATLDQALAQANITAQQDQTSLADARFAVERAQVQVEQAVIHGRIQGDESRIDLGLAQQKLKVQEAAVGLHQASDKSRVASLTRQREQARADVELNKARIAQMELKAPLSGLLTLRTNYTQACFANSDCKPFKVGDNVSSNMPLGQIPDLTTLEMVVKLEETDRGRVLAGQDVLLRIDAFPELTIPAKIRELSALAEMSMGYPYTPSFSAYAPILRPDPRLRPEMYGGMDVVVSRIPDAISIPSKALFSHGGKPVVYLAEGGRYREVKVEVLARNPDEVAISGIPAGSTVALVDVTRQEQKK
jgi:HlyD family secretion protein